MTSPHSKTVVITGCSSGIGWATALHLAQQGFTVYATARNLDSIRDLEQAGCHILALDVTDEASMEAAVNAVEQEQGAIDVLINNAGYSQSGAIESVAMQRVRQQFETNVFGLVRMTQLVLPGMRQQRKGTIINLSSMGGRLTFPGGGFYHATKYAIEALTDALRFEVAGYGIDAILIEPGLIRTRFGDVAAKSVGQTSASENSYVVFNTAVVKASRDIYERGPLAPLGGTAEDVARTISQAITSHNPKARYTVTPSARLLITVRRMLPDRLWDRFLSTQFPRPH